MPILKINRSTALLTLSCYIFSRSYYFTEISLWLIT